LRVGVLAVQGDVREHAAVLRRLDADVAEVRKPDQLAGLDGLVIPGGESTTIGRLMRLYGLWDAVHEFPAPIFGTCAGMIVCARDAADAARGQEFLGLADIVVRRNGYGRQVASFETELRVEGDDEPLHAVFIRAPRVEELGPAVEVLASHGGEPVLVRDGRVLLAAFHPELTDDTRVHEWFLQLVEEEANVRA
jgi:5'-phosphate synthase pdxT subunit